MKTSNYVNLIMLFVLSLSFASCSDDNYYTDDFLRNSDEKICSKEWVDEYESNGKLYQHRLIFYKDYRGKEKIRTYIKLSDGKWNPDYSERSDPFTWTWINAAKEGLTLDFYGERTAVFHDVWAREYYLSGKLNGEEKTFMDIKYSQLP